MNVRPALMQSQLPGHLQRYLKTGQWIEIDGDCVTVNGVVGRSIVVVTSW